jgi:hypothetical protein
MEGILFCLRRSVAFTIRFEFFKKTELRTHIATALSDRSESAEISSRANAVRKLGMMAGATYCGKGS